MTLAPTVRRPIMSAGRDSVCITRKTEADIYCIDPIQENGRNTQIASLRLEMLGDLHQNQFIHNSLNQLLQGHTTMLSSTMPVPTNWTHAPPQDYHHKQSRYPSQQESREATWAGRSISLGAFQAETSQLNRFDHLQTLTLRCSVNRRRLKCRQK